MGTEVMITVRGEEAACAAPGTMERTADGFRVVYEEPAALGMGAVTTALAVSEGRAVLTRTGAVRCEMRFEEGAAHATVYETALGSFPAEVYTRSLRTRLGGRGGLIEIRYALTLGGAESERRLKLLIRAKEDGA